MTATERTGATPTLDAFDLTSFVGGELPGVVIEPVTFAKVPSAQLSYNDIIELSGLIRSHFAAGTDAAVVVQGTDTLEETAFALDLLASSDRPIVVTGAMRHAGALGADGPANLFGAIATAAHGVTAGIGVTVVMNDEIHAARFVQKSHTTNLAAFRSSYGPIGWVGDDGPHVVLRPGCRLALPAHPRSRISPHVPLLTVGFGDDDVLIRRGGQSLDGLVVEALGGGHVPTQLAGPLIDLAGHIPVVLSSRTGSGPVLTKTYGFEGSERHLLSSGLLSSRWLNARKARMLLALLLHCELATSPTDSFRDLLCD